MNEDENEDNVGDISHGGNEQAVGEQVGKADQIRDNSVVSGSYLTGWPGLTRHI